MVDSSQEKRVLAWLRRELFGKEDKCARIVIRHYSANGKMGMEVSTIRIDEDFDVEGLPGLAEEIQNRCISDAECLGEFQKYVVLPYRIEEDEPHSRLILKFNLSDEFDDAFDSEPKNQTGILAQAMRHTEASMKLAVGSSGNVMAMQNRIITRQAEQIETLTEKHIELMTLIEELQSHRHERDLEIRSAETKQNVMEEGARKVMALLPVAVNKLIGAKTMEENSSLGEIMMSGFVETLRPEQLNNIMNTLDPQQKIMMISFLERVAKDREVKKEPNGASESSRGE